MAQVRELLPDERPNGVTPQRATLPLVLEPAQLPTIAALATPAALGAVLESRAAAVCKLLQEHGALLLRGWNVCGPTELAAAVRGLSPHLLPMADYFPAEHGRDERHRVPFGSEVVTVWPTNSLARTGGYLLPEVVPHTENFYALTPPPRVVCFCCERAPWLGGETALVDGAAAVESLPEDLRGHLAKPFTIRRFHSLARLRRRHGLQPNELLALANRTSAEGLTVRAANSGGGGESGAYIELCMGRVAASPTPPPPLYCGSDGPSTPPSPPTSAATTMRFNFGEIGGRKSVRAALLAALLQRGFFGGRSWAPYRWLWALAFKHPATVARLLGALDALPGWLTRPLSMMRRAADARGAAQAEAAADAAAMGGTAGRAGSVPRAPETLADRLSELDAQRLAGALTASANGVDLCAVTLCPCAPTPPPTLP